jgi:hypothetical protein
MSPWTPKRQRASDPTTTSGTQEGRPVMPAPFRATNDTLTAHCDHASPLMQAFRARDSAVNPLSACPSRRSAA